MSFENPRTNSRESLKRRVGLLALEGLERVGGLCPLLSKTDRLIGLGSGDGYETTDALGDSVRLDDGEGLDVRGLVDVASGTSDKRTGSQRARRVLLLTSPASLRKSDRADSRSTTELHTCPLPLRVLHILRDVLDVVLERHHPHRIRIRLSEHSPEARDLLREVEGKLFRVDLGSPGDPVVNNGLDLEKILGRDGSLVREVEPKLGGRDEGALLVDVVAKDVSESVVEDVGGGVVLSDWGSSGLGDKKSREDGSQL
jgi:hypothetical protein